MPISSSVRGPRKNDAQKRSAKPGLSAVEGGAVSDWIDTPSNQTISVDGVRLELALDDPADDRATPGARAPYLDGYLAYSAATLPAGSPSFTVPTGRD